MGLDKWQHHFGVCLKFLMLLPCLEIWDHNVDNCWGHASAFLVAIAQPLGSNTALLAMRNSCVYTYDMCIPW